MNQSSTASYSETAAIDLPDDISLDNSTHTFGADYLDNMPCNHDDAPSTHEINFAYSMFLEEETHRIVDSPPPHICAGNMQGVEQKEAQFSFTENFRRNRLEPSNTAPSNNTAPSQPVPYNHFEYQGKFGDNEPPTPYNHLQFQRRVRNNVQDMFKSTNYSAATASTDFSRESRIQRRVSFDSCNFSSDDSCSSGNNGADKNCFRRMRREISYEESLRKLAQSIKRTELSRRQLIAHRSRLGAPVPASRHCHPARRTVSTACLRLQMRVAGRCHPELLGVGAPSRQQRLHRQMVANAVVSSRPFSQERRKDLPRNDRFSTSAAFFSGARGTLTDGLEHSRRQLKIYLDQMSLAMSM